MKYVAGTLLVVLLLLTLYLNRELGQLQESYNRLKVSSDICFTNLEEFQKQSTERKETVVVVQTKAAEKAKPIVVRAKEILEKPVQAPESCESLNTLINEYLDEVKE